jgi:hypothetical protein
LIFPVRKIVLGGTEFLFLSIFWRKEGGDREIEAVLGMQREGHGNKKNSISGTDFFLLSIF